MYLSLLYLLGLAASIVAAGDPIHDMALEKAPVCAVSVFIPSNPTLHYTIPGASTDD